MNDMLGDLKKKLMNDDMWEAFDTIVYLVGKFVEYIHIPFFYNLCTLKIYIDMTKYFRKCEKNGYGGQRVQQLRGSPSGNSQED